MDKFDYNIRNIVEFLGGGINDALVFNLIGVFVKSLNDEMPVLSEAVINLDKPRIHKIGHKLKGSSANLGFERFRKLCEELEQHARHDLDFDYAGVFSYLQEEKTAIENWYNSEKDKYTI